MMRLSVFAIAALLGGCATAARPEPVSVTVSGPKFPPSAFTCKGDAIPPDPAKVGDKAGSAAGSYEAAQRAVAADCRNKLLDDLRTGTEAVKRRTLMLTVGAIFTAIAAWITLGMRH